MEMKSISKKAFSTNSNSITMNKDPYCKMEHFVDIATNKNIMEVFLDIAKNRVRKLEELSEDTGLGLEDLAVSIRKLEDGDFIIKNPNPLSDKFKLGFNGQLFAEQLKIIYPDVREFLGKESLIEPLK